MGAQRLDWTRTGVGPGNLKRAMYECSLHGRCAVSWVQRMLNLRLDVICAFSNIVSSSLRCLYNVADKVVLVPIRRRTGLSESASDSPRFREVCNLVGGGWLCALNICGGRRRSR